MPETVGRIFNLQRFSTEDGPGIRTTVFTKGCPLRCLWCANPESQLPERQTVCRRSKCIGCGACAAACPSAAVTAEGERGVRIDRAKCTACGACAEACPSGAMSFYGREVTVSEVFAMIERDAGYYASSGGGVTVSGGEPMTQPDFTAGIFERCRASGIHTALDTCGFFEGRLLDRILPLTSLVLFDLKLMDAEAHRRYTGAGNAQILENAAEIAARGVPMRIRIPLIPGVNDSEENLEATAGFVAGLEGECPVDLLPYHKFGLNKYEMLGMTYMLGGTKPPEEREKLRCRAVFERHGLKCEVH